MIRIITPEPAIGRTRFLDVDFIDGVATVEDLHPIREQALIQHGYSVTAELEVGGEPVGQDAPIFDLTKATKPQLLVYAKEHSIDVPAKATKPELVRIIGEAPAGPIPGSVDNGDGSFSAPGVVDDAGATIAAETQGALSTEPVGDGDGDAPDSVEGD